MTLILHFFISGRDLSQYLLNIFCKNVAVICASLLASKKRHGVCAGVQAAIKKSKLKRQLQLAQSDQTKIQDFTQTKDPSANLEQSCKADSDASSSSQDSQHSQPTCDRKRSKNCQKAKATKSDLVKCAAEKGKGSKQVASQSFDHKFQYKYKTAPKDVSLDLLAIAMPSDSPTTSRQDTWAD